jgi:phosphatidate cytidylyltransferase
VTRVLSGAVLLILAITAVWLASPLTFLVIAETFVVLACREYGALARGAGLRIPLVVSTAATMLTAAAFAPIALRALFWAPVDTVLMSAMVTAGALSLVRWEGGRDALATVSAALLPVLYLGLPIGSIIAVREIRGASTLFLLMVTVFSSDIAQYYAGRLFGRRPLAPIVSPKKTVEGALGGFVVGAMVTAMAGHWWLPESPVMFRALLGVTLVALGIAGDLFESLLKRSAGVKDSSSLIPGHGGVLDRVDALLFAAPIYYVVLKYL